MATGEFTRGSADAADPRGGSMVRGRGRRNALAADGSGHAPPTRPLTAHARTLSLSSQVQKHAERLAAARQVAALEALAGDFPAVSPAVLAAALEEAPPGDGGDPASAAALVRLFVEARAGELKGWAGRLKAVRRAEGADGSGDGGASTSEEAARGRRSDRKKKSKDKDKKASRRRSRHRSDSGVEDEDDDDRRRRRHKKRSSKHAKRRRRSASSTSSGSSDEEDRRRHKKAAAAAAAPPAFGAHGILRATDLESKRPEFTAWAAEVKGVDVEALPGRRGGGVERELFSEFAEDFNTGTLPAPKFYDLAAWQASGSRKEEGGGGGGAAGAGPLTDEAAAAAARAAERNAAQAARVRDAYLALKFSDVGKVEAMKAQAVMRTEAALAFRTGDTEKAARLMEKLKPEERR